MEKSKRNSLIEVLRFVFALFIVFYHNLFIVELNVFCNANYFVDFFFLVTGMYLIRGFEKYKDQSFVGGSYRFFLDKIIKFGIPLLISYVALIFSNLISTPNEIKSRYLWFIHIMLILFIVYFLFYKIFKNNKKAFCGVVIAMFLISAFFRYAVLIDFGNDTINNLFLTTYYYDELRGVQCMSLGILLSEVPSFLNKDGKKTKSLSIIILTISIVLISFLLVISSFGFKEKVSIEIVNDLILFPALIYFSRYVVIENKTMDILGESSIYIYIYQTVCLLERSLNVTNQVVLFLTLVFMVLITMIWKIELRRRKAPKTQSV